MRRCDNCGHEMPHSVKWAERLARGAYMGGPMPFGFTWNESAQEWETVESEYLVLLEIQRLRADGIGVRRIAAELNRRGIPTPKGGEMWRPSSVDQILKNPFYARMEAA